MSWGKKKKKRERLEENVIRLKTSKKERKKVQFFFRF
jgi:hypothetical protein